jgi:hypothetical protein
MIQKYKIKLAWSLTKWSTKANIEIYKDLEAMSGGVKDGSVRFKGLNGDL